MLEKSFINKNTDFNRFYLTNFASNILNKYNTIILSGYINFYYIFQRCEFTFETSYSNAEKLTPVSTITANKATN